MGFSAIGNNQHLSASRIRSVLFLLLFNEITEQSPLKESKGYTSTENS
jgi:hypothetical protein